MADVSEHTYPPALPPPIYSLARVRSGSPNIITPHEDENHNVSAYRQNNVYNASPPAMKPSISMVPPQNVQHSGSHGSVQIHPPHGASSTQMTNGISTVRTLTPQQSQYQDPTRLSPSPQSMPRRRPLDEQHRNTSESSHRRIVSEVAYGSDPVQAPDARQKAKRHVSTSFIEPEQQMENFEPLKYHHQAVEDEEMKTLDKRASKLTMGTNQSESSATSDPYKSDPAPTGNVRNSIFGRALQRPDSGFSSTSDLRGRTNSPQLSPARPASRNSRSPDARPLSYIDLLNVPYPQAAPSGAENLVNSQLRTAVGTNASLLSTRKTLEMYRQNVKKTNDPAIQYEFAVFMIGAAQEEGLEMDTVSVSATSEKSHVSAREDLLKEAKHILQKLCDKSYPFAQYYLADGYASGLFNRGREDWERAFPLFLAASKHGHAEAGYRTALCYEFGWGCRVDGMKAVQFYQHAASKNHPGAMLRLGRACLTGDMGLTKRYREGIRWLKRGAEAADFQYNQAP